MPKSSSAPIGGLKSLQHEMLRILLGIWNARRRTESLKDALAELEKNH